MAKTYFTAETVEQIAAGLIPNYHPELATARILYLFVDKASKRGGKDVLGKAQKVTGWTQFALERDFMLVIASDKWNELDPNQRTALVDHLLERCTGEEADEDGGSMKWSMREPDVQEFGSILQRYGAWHDDLVSFVNVAQQIELDDIIEDESEVDLAQALAEATTDTSTLN